MNKSRPPGPPSDEPPQVPGFKSWKAVYIVVLASLLFYIAALAVWSRWLQ